MVTETSNVNSFLQLYHSAGGIDVVTVLALLGSFPDELLKHPPCVPSLPIGLCPDYQLN